MNRTLGALGVASVAALAPGALRAAPYDSVYVFGDSLSDRGNLAETGVLQAAAGQAPPYASFPTPPSNHDSFTNGPVAVSLLANSLGRTADPSLWVAGFKDPNGLFGPGYVPGSNYAVAGATSAAQAVGGPPAINLPQQVAAYNAFSGGKADPNALYTVFVGGNDVRNAALQGTGQAAITAGVQAELTAIQALVTQGARNLFVVNVPNVGVIPEFAQDDPAQALAATNDSIAYDAGLSAGLATLATPAGTALTSFDLYSFNSQIIANAAQLGFTDTTDRCYTATPLSAATSAQCGPGAQNIGGFIYWDSFHPTARVQALWATGFEQALAGIPNPSPAPEPGSVALLLAGLAGLAAVARRRA